MQQKYFRQLLFIVVYGPWEDAWQVKKIDWCLIQVRIMPIILTAIS